MFSGVAEGNGVRVGSGFGVGVGVAITGVAVDLLNSSPASRNLPANPGTIVGVGGKGVAVTTITTGVGVSAGVAVITTTTGGGTGLEQALTKAASNKNSDAIRNLALERTTTELLLAFALTSAPGSSPDYT